MEQIEGAVTVAKGISDWGMMAMTAAFFLVLSAGLMVACFKWFKSIINDIIKGQKDTMSELLEETRTQNSMLATLTEGLKPEVQLRIKNTSNVYFDLAKEQVCRMIKKIREENHIADREATGKKIRSLLRNLHEDRNSRFDCYTYKGNKLSSYTNSDWIEKVALVVESEIYNESGPNNGRAYTNVSTVYDDIKLDFYHRLNDV
ncbi:hypothetical protein [Parabacteroides sp.]|jgi:hypothetical protein|uniref:hypothetical protein n=1 Tax=Parabacteroides sp. TaxID=1869337 RepID=UPI001D4A5E57|nr:hypothetical protein [Parabacteroides sp.]MBS5485455.1 hypothetical protein [Parabacteroides sp.]DAE61722.1 MAG TPA: hypothetical protein [Caudoviricetes sp.]